MVLKVSIPLLLFIIRIPKNHVYVTASIKIKDLGGFDKERTP